MKRVIIIGMAAVALSLGACGKKVPPPVETPPPAQTTDNSNSTDPNSLEVVELPALQADLVAKAGSDTFDFTNDAPIAHDFTIETSSGQKVAATPIFSGGTKSATATLKPGTYTFLCTVPGHADAGMKGTLTVK